eukprot:3491421-Prorocentrum_lima.AAC.1
MHDKHTHPDRQRTILLRHALEKAQVHPGRRGHEQRDADAEHDHEEGLVRGLDHAEGQGGAKHDPHQNLDEAGGANGKGSALAARGLG